MSKNGLQTETVYISAAVNRFPKCAAVSPNSHVVAFGSHKLIAIWNLEDHTKASISEALFSHEALVTCVHFLNSGVIISGDEDGKIAITIYSNNQWKTVERHDSHSRAVTFLSSEDELVVSGGSDSSVKIWRFDSSKFDLILQEIIPLGGKLPLDAALRRLPFQNKLVLAVATTSDIITLYAQEGQKFVCKLALSGHEDWVRCLAMVTHLTGGGSNKAERLLLASGSQDGSIRVWSIGLLSATSPLAIVHNAEATHEQILDSMPNEVHFLVDTSQIESKQQVFKIVNDDTVDAYYSVLLDALLVGHEAGVTSLCWNQNTLQTGTPSIMSTSTDSSLILWSPSSSIKDESLWIIRQRFGDLGGQRLGGFVGGLWASEGYAALAYGWNGCWRRWCLLHPASYQWTEAVAITGHNDEVRGVSWSPGGEYLLSTSSDQTTRVHAPLSSNSNWHEIGRPQIHGYDLVEVVQVGNFRFASIAEEKVVRIFESPQSFVRVMKQLGAFQGEDESKRTASVRLPPLGLSNKAIGKEGSNSTASFVDIVSSCVLESNLSSVTLWPEIEKLFGHGYELNALAVSHSSQLVATSCRATTAEHAVIRLFNSRTWQPCDNPLTGHTLTVTRICWSTDDKFILSVSRDRTWRIFVLTDEGVYVPACWKKSHSRVIWDCAWLPLSHVFVTGSRDKTVQVWELSSSANRCAYRQNASISFDHPVTALDITSNNDSENVLLSIGLENGEVHFYLAKKSDLVLWTLMKKIRMFAGIVERLSWRPNRGCLHYEIAIASGDRSLRIVKIHF